MHVNTSHFTLQRCKIKVHDKIVMNTTKRKYRNQISTMQQDLQSLLHSGDVSVATKTCPVLLKLRSTSTDDIVIIIADTTMRDILGILFELCM